MSKRTRQYIGILAALAAYYLVHEGAHLLYALLTGVFKQITMRCRESPSAYSCDLEETHQTEKGDRHDAADAKRNPNPHG